MMPDITYLVRTTGKRNEWLKAALASVREQTHPSRVVLVHDGTPHDRERTRSGVWWAAMAGCYAYQKAPDVGVAESLGEMQVRAEREGSRFSIVESGGCSMPSAHNAGVEAVTTPYLVTLDDDDVVYPHHAATLVRELEADPGVGVAHARIWLVDAHPTTNEPIRKRFAWGRAFTADELKGDNKVPIHGAMQRTELAKADLMREEDGPCCDYGHWLRLVAKGVRFQAVDDVVGEYRVRNSEDSNGFKRAEMIRFTQAVRAKWGRF